MTEEDLEAAIWRSMAAHRVRCPREEQARFVDEVKAAARQHAAYTGGITAERRAALAPEVTMRVHFWPAEEFFSACGSVARDMPGAQMTTTAASVTCGTCKLTGAYRKARGAQRQRGEAA